MKCPPQLSQGLGNSGPAALVGQNSQRLNTARPAVPPDGRVGLSSPVDIATDGKFLRAGRERFLIKGVTYGTFAPDADGYQFPSAQQIAQDFRPHAVAEADILETNQFSTRLVTDLPPA